MDIQGVKDLMNQFDQSSLTEFDLREGSFELYMNKNKTSRQVQTTNNEVATEGPTSVTPSVVETTETIVETVETTVPKAGDIISSPIVGVVYLKPAPDQSAFKGLGDTVKKGETICIIEAMKLLNEITSEFDGTITEILVENEEVVEYNQPLFRIS